LASLGFDIAIHYNNSAAAAEQLAGELQQEFGIKSSVYRADFNQLQQVRGLVEAVRKDMPGLSVLINNASIFEKVGFMETSPYDFERNFNVHARAPFFLIQDLAKYCKEGQVVNIVDTNVVRAHSEYFAYMLSKKTLYDLTMMTARMLAPNFRVNAIAPGVIMPPPHVDKERYEKESQNNILRRAATPADIEHALEYLITSRQVTGEVLFVDGGDHVGF